MINICICLLAIKNYGNNWIKFDELYCILCYPCLIGLFNVVNINKYRLLFIIIIINELIYEIVTFYIS